MAKKSNSKRADGRIAVQVYIGMVDGKRKYKTVYGRTQKEADNKAKELKAQLLKGIDLTQDSEFGFWRDAWLKSKKKLVSEPQFKDTQARCRYFDDISKIKLTALRPIHIQQIIDELAEFNPHTGNPSSHRLLVEVKNIAVQIIDFAIENRVTDYNPAKYVKISAQATPNERRALTKEEQRWIVETPHRAQTAAMIMMYAGLRRGELTALTWNDIDLDNKTITVNKSYNFRTRQVKSPKTKSGYRTVFIPDILCEYLKNVKKNNILVFPASSGKIMSSTAWKRLWESYMLDLDIKYGRSVKKQSKYAPMKHIYSIQTFTPHCLRHTYCTLLYESGVDILVAKELMGHSDIQTTLDIYTHLSQEHKVKDIDKLNTMLSNF